MPKEGSKAPAFCLPSADKAKVWPQGFLRKMGGVVFLPQRQHQRLNGGGSEFSELKPKFEKLGAVVLGVSPDSVESHRKFAEKNKITATLLSDIEHFVIKAYDAWGTKQMYAQGVRGSRAQHSAD